MNSQKQINLRLKHEMALKLLEAGVSSRKIRERTKKRFGTGIGQGYLTAIRKEIDAKRAPEKMGLKKAMKKYNKAQRKLMEDQMGLPALQKETPSPHTIGDIFANETKIAPKPANPHSIFRKPEAEVLNGQVKLKLLARALGVDGNMILNTLADNWLKLMAKQIPNPYAGGQS